MAVSHTFVVTGPGAAPADRNAPGVERKGYWELWEEKRQTLAADFSRLKERLVKAELEQAALSRREFPDAATQALAEARKNWLGVEIERLIHDIEVKDKELNEHMRLFQKKLLRYHIVS